jgi:hypothetical protein
MRAAIEQALTAKADPLHGCAHLPGWEDSIAWLRLRRLPLIPLSDFGNFLFDPTSVTPIELLPQR